MLSLERLNLHLTDPELALPCQRCKHAVERLMLCVIAHFEAKNELTGMSAGRSKGCSSLCLCWVSNSEQMLKEGLGGVAYALWGSSGKVSDSATRAKSPVPGRTQLERQGCAAS